ncbi:protein rer1 [Anaeramoeba ignava]|uniref:Protein rer1 n=1 Tax=Anaeramoeba ignava TaxID=1746090 RepID=A0A9Q0LDX6_ANAIG|nr:protein rer1 [Anaeramoeba ignava]
MQKIKNFFVSFKNIIKKIFKKYQRIRDTFVPLSTIRWSLFGILLIIFFARVIITQRYFVVSYCLGVFLLNYFINFLSPKIDPELAEQEEEIENEINGDQQETTLPIHSNDEFKPFMRKLPEYKFWEKSFYATIISLFSTLSDDLDFPIYWPLLLFYFLILFLVAMRNQLAHMIKYRYIPFNFKKKKFNKKKNSTENLNNQNNNNNDNDNNNNQLNSFQVNALNTAFGVNSNNDSLSLNYQKKPNQTLKPIVSTRASLLFKQRNNLRKL